MKRQRFVLAIDSGTTGTTALVVDEGGAAVGRGYREMSQHYPRPGWVEHDPEEIVTVAREAVATAVRESAVDARSIACVGITNQRETTILWERATGRPIHPAIVWQCRRTTSDCQRLEARGLTREFRKKTGLVLDAYFSGTKVRWILDHVKGSARRAERGELAFGTVDSWLLSRMTGVHATDTTNASRTLLLDIHRRQWDETLAGHLGVPMALRPEVRPPASEFGRTRGFEPVPDGTPVMGIAGDQQAALFGQACLFPGEAKNTYGTGCFLLMNTGQKGVTSKAGLLTTLAADKRGQTCYALEGAVFIAGAAVQWLRDGLGLVEHAAQTDAIARSVPDTGGVHFVPAFVGLGAPYWDPRARGAILGLTRGTTRAHVVRAALEAMAFQTQEVALCMVGESGIRLKEIKVDGGAAANDFLCQFQADISGVPVDRPRNVETTALGAAYLAGVAAGIWDAEGLSLVRVTERRFTPSVALSARKRRERLEAWREAVGRVLSR